MNIYIGSNSRLPSEYQEVEYIQSSGTQYIKIGTSFKTSYKCVIDFQMTVTGGDYIPLGVRDSSYRYGIDAYNGYFMIISGGSDWTNTISEDTSRHKITIDKSSATVDSTDYSISYIDHTYTDGIGVFYYRSISSPDAYFASNKLYKLDIYDENGTHIYDLVPCYRKSDSVIGLYDLVNSVFYTNQGTGTFSKGNDVTMSEIKNIYIGEAPYDGDELCFTANTANSTVKLTKTGSPTSVTFETSTDGRTWTTYTFGTDITLSNIGDKVYWRNTSETDTLLNSTYYNGNWYHFVMTGSIAASGDINYILNKNSTTTLSNYCYPRLFKECTSLTTPPKLPATTLAEGCYREMFYGCNNLTVLPSLNAITLANFCYESMFERCTKIKLSTTKTGEYQTEYRIPTTGTGTTATYALYNMFASTNGTFTGTPSINTTYYTSNTVV